MVTTVNIIEGEGRDLQDCWKTYNILYENGDQQTKVINSFIRAKIHNSMGIHHKNIVIRLQEVSNAYLCTVSNAMPQFT